MSVSIVIPTYDEADNAAELIRRLNCSLVGLEAEILFVDDGTDDLPVRALNTPSVLPVRVLRRPEAVGGLSGAVVLGIQHSTGELVVVMDGDLQHPPESVPALLQAAAGSDVVIASRYVDDGDAGGLGGGFRKVVSRSTGALSRVLLPKLRDCTDPMSGFFAVRRSAVELSRLHPRGFKILLEILARTPRLRVAEVPFVFGERHAGQSHAGVKEGIRFLRQLLALPFSSRALRFALVGLSGILPNLLVLSLLTDAGTSTVVAAACGTQAAIAWNFFGAELLVWRDVRAGKLQRRFVKFLLIGELDLLRLPLLVPLTHAGMDTLVASILTMVVFFTVRFLLANRIVYRGPLRRSLSNVALPLQPIPVHPLSTEDVSA